MAETSYHSENGLMLRKVFLRIENFLLIVPILVSYFFYVFFPDGVLNVVLFDEYITISVIEGSLFLILIFSIPFIFHHVLREKKLRDVAITRLHVVLSIIIIIAIALIYKRAPLVSPEWKNEILPPPIYDKWVYIVHIAYALWQLFIFIQVGFIVYALGKLKQLQPKHNAE